MIFFKTRIRGGISISRRFGLTLLEMLFAMGLVSLISVGLASLMIFSGRSFKSINSQQIALKHAKTVVETLNSEIRPAQTASLRVVDQQGNTAQKGNAVEFSHYNETVIRRIELQPGSDNDIATPFDNILVFDPDVAVSENERTIVQGLSPLQSSGGFEYSGGMKSLIIRMRTGDSVIDGVQSEMVAQTGPGMQGVEINITIAPRN